MFMNRCVGSSTPHASSYLNFPFSLYSVSYLPPIIQPTAFISKSAQHPDSQRHACASGFSSSRTIICRHLLFQLHGTSTARLVTLLVNIYVPRELGIDSILRLSGRKVVR